MLYFAAYKTRQKTKFLIILCKYYEISCSRCLTVCDRNRQVTHKEEQSFFFVCFLSPEIEYDNFGLLQFRTVNVGNHFLFSSLLRMFLIRKHDVRTLHSERRS